MNLKKNEKYFVNIDFDGTLYFQNNISTYNKKTIKKYQKLGHKFILNTGRSKGNIPKEAFKIKWDYILCGASYIEDGNGYVLFHKFLDEKQIETAIRFSIRYLASFDMEGEKRNVSFKKEDIMNLSKDEQNEFIKKFIEENKDNPITKVSIWKGMDNRIDDKLPGFHVLHHQTYLECFIEGTDKGTLIDKFISLVKTDEEHLIGLGDSLNDLDMFSRCKGAKGAMKLANDKLKEEADYITKRSTTGVGEAIREFLDATK